MTKPKKLNKQGLPILNSKGFNGRKVPKGPCEHFTLVDWVIVGTRYTEDGLEEHVYGRPCVHCKEVIDRV
jgi:hypothetical protein